MGTCALCISVDVEDLFELDDEAPVILTHVILEVLLEQVDGLARYPAHQLILGTPQQHFLTTPAHTLAATFSQ